MHYKYTDVTKIEFCIVVGLIKFEKVALSELEADMEPSAGDSQSVLSFTTASILENCVGQMREAIGVDSHIQPDSISIRYFKLL